ncbi:hypothetical protein MNKW57_03930 [Biformimicrobium ophioploci]|uniref:Flavodoxin-like fold domain-containing protein n=1 Tax=Biformimicrobium ophioploci TaxID=3036711 RepID=A0ABQ6LVF2_9GAMM|nr:hypothetical protein MNKW57_03930 [Microbulbifer sp. NKW57]
MDCVFEPGFAFGEGGIALRDKYLCNAVSTGASLEAYSEPGASLEQYLLPFRQTAAFCGMRYLQPFVVHAPHEMRNDDSEVKKTAQTYARALSFLTKANKFDICEFGGGQYLNQQINP